LLHSSGAAMPYRCGSSTVAATNIIPTDDSSASQLAPTHRPVLYRTKAHHEAPFHQQWLSNFSLLIKLLEIKTLHQALQSQLQADCGIMLPSNNSIDASTPQDWTLQPQQGGTIDIIWACVITISLCSWSVLCLNIPVQKDSSMARKL
jgi:hypothetical protein